MRLLAPLVTALLVAATACMRTPLQPHGGGGDEMAGGNGVGGAGGSANGTGGATVPLWPSGGNTTAGTTGRGTGGTPGLGGATRTGGMPAVGGSAGGRAGAGGSATGGAAGAGGRRGTGGSAIGTGGRTGTGGTAVGSGGRIGTGGITAGSGGRIGTGGVGVGGSGYDAGSTDALPATGGRATGGTSGVGGAGGTAGTCGDGVIDRGEQCDLGPDNRASAAFSVTQAGRTFNPVPVVRSESGAACYDYRSSSAHTGFEAVGTSRIMLYFDRSTFALSLIVFHGIDKDSTGEVQPESQVQMLFSGLPETTAINVADESNELLMTSATTATGLWTFNENSDGGVLGGLPFPGDWTITVDPKFTKGISAWTWINSDGSFVDLDPSQPLTIEARSSHSQCRPDCTVPDCGDAILDGGEICDDGRPSPSGCSMNCQSFN